MLGQTGNSAYNATVNDLFSALRRLDSQSVPLGVRSDGASETVLNRIAVLENRLARLTLINQALWEILRERENFADDLLALKVAEIDLRDGQLDGKSRSAPQTCPKCKRTLQVGSQRCMYCGEFAANADVFRGL